MSMKRVKNVMGALGIDDVAHNTMRSIPTYATCLHNGLAEQKIRDHVQFYSSKWCFRSYACIAR
eukprot:3608094-Amphidinium_carterae.1